MRVLARSLTGGRTPHAFLLEGPAGVGKRTAARALAAALLCGARDGDAAGQGGLFGDASPAPAADACGQCDSCRLFAGEQHPDHQRIYRGLHKLHPDRSVRTSRGHFVTVDVIRHFLLEPAALSPSVSQRRVFTIEDAERMNEAAQNALLKTLEEPPGPVSLVLITTSADRLLATIRSRCQRVGFGLLPPDFVAEALQARTGVDEQAAVTLARLAEGRLGVALQWQAADVLVVLERVAALLLAHDPHDPERFAKEGLALASELVERVSDATEDEDEDDAATGSAAQRQGLTLFFALLAALFRDALVRQTGGAAAESLLAARTCADQTLRLADRYASLDACQAAIHAIATSETLLDRNVAPQLVLEHCAVALTRPEAPLRL